MVPAPGHGALMPLLRKPQRTVARHAADAVSGSAGREKRHGCGPDGGGV